MPSFLRHDRTPKTPVSASEAERRWRQHQDVVARQEGQSWKVVARRLLGASAVRPVTKALRAFSPSATTHQAAREISGVRGARCLATHSTNGASVAVVTVGQNKDAAWQEVATAVNEATTTWIYLVPEALSPAEQEHALVHLLGDERGDVRYCDTVDLQTGAVDAKPANIAPHSLLSYDVVGLPALVRRSCLQEGGGLSVAERSAIVHGAFLRLQEAGASFVHVPHLCNVDTVVPPTTEDLVACITAALVRRGISGEVRATPTPGLVDWQPSVPSPAPRVSIVIPTRDRLDLVQRCIASIEAQTTYDNWTIVLCDNDSVEPSTLDYFAASPYQVVPCPGSFNYSAIINAGVRASDGDVIVTLNNDTEIVTPNWLERLVGLATLPDVAIVGAKLVDAAGVADHEGIVMAPFPQHLRSATNYAAKDAFIAATRDVVAVTGAVQAFRRDVFDNVGGMDEALKVVTNDVDFCLRAQADGQYVVYTPFVEILHEVSASRGSLTPNDERVLFLQRWDVFGSFRDPFFGERLELVGEQLHYRQAP